MEKRNVWRVIKRTPLPKDRSLVESKWVFDMKRSELFKVRLVTCGYSQIPGVYFTESYAIVINDARWRTLIVAMLVWKFDAKIINVSTEFLYGDLEEDIYMKCSEVHGKDEALHLLHAIYSLVQSARQYYLKFTKKLKKLGFVRGYPDPCLMTRINKNGICFIAIWVEDSLLVGQPKATQQRIDYLQREGFDLKLDGSLDDYLSCKITFDRKRNLEWIHQPNFITKSENKFGDCMKYLQVYKTPRTSGLRTLRNPNTTVDIDKHAMYQIGVGVLLYLLKHTCPDIANDARELSKSLDCLCTAAYKEMLHVIKFVLDTRNLAIKFDPTELINYGWIVLAYSDSNVGGDKETRISISSLSSFLWVCQLAGEARARSW